MKNLQKGKTLVLAAAGVAMISASTAVISERSAMPGTFVSPANLIFVPVMFFIMLLLMNM